MTYKTLIENPEFVWSEKAYEILFNDGSTLLVEKTFKTGENVIMCTDMDNVEYIVPLTSVKYIRKGEVFCYKAEGKNYTRFLYCFTTDGNVTFSNYHGRKPVEKSIRREK